MSHPHNGHADAHAAVVDLLPAGARDSHNPGHHGHTIVPLRLLVGVLVILLVFTVLTVTAANTEEWFAHAFNVQIPGWVNAVVALSIACVKSIIVAMYFMQLRYDQNPMNALVCVFTIMVATFFLGFTAIDLGNRGIIYGAKGQQLIAGGSGGLAEVPAGTSIAMYARQKADAVIDQAIKDDEDIHNHAYLKRLYIRFHELEALATKDEAQHKVEAQMKAYMDKRSVEFAAVAAEVNAHGHGAAREAGNTANTSRPVSGITLPGLGAAPAHGAEGHAPAPQPAPAH